MDKPNVLLLIPDQLRADCVGYARACPVRTPNIDALANESVVYEQAYCAMPICAPMRQALLTGRDPNRFGAITNHSIVPTPPVDPRETWTAKAHAAGYTGSLIGNLDAPYTCSMEAFGFDYYDTWAQYNARIDARYGKIDWKNGFYGEASPLLLEDSLTHWTSYCACEHIKAFAKEGKPWFLWTEFLAPHLPCRPSEPFSLQYAPEDIPMWPGFGDAFVDKPYIQRQQSWNWHLENAVWANVAPIVARYYAMISQLDDAIGQILDCLDKTGQRDNTIVVFASDHGDMCGSHQTMDKGYVLYDDVVHVPMSVRVPGVAPISQRGFVSSFLDLTASLYRWLPIQAEGVLDGRALSLDIAGRDAERKSIVSAYNGQQFGLYCQRMLRDSRYKYIWNATDTDEFYDLIADPGEKSNLIGRAEQADRIAGMRANLYQVLRAQGDYLFREDWLSGQLLEGRKCLRQP